MRGSIFTLYVWLISVLVYAQPQVHHEEDLKVSISFGKEYNYKHIEVTRVIDGNIFKLENGEVVRLIGVDIPKGKEAQAKEFARYYFEGRIVRLVFGEKKKDKDGRWLAYVFVDNITAQYPGFDQPERMWKYTRAIGTSGISWYPVMEEGILSDFINASMIESGYGTPMSVKPNHKYAAIFDDVYREARKNKIGIWHDTATDLNYDHVLILPFNGAHHSHTTFIIEDIKGGIHF